MLGTPVGTAVGTEDGTAVGAGDGAGVGDGVGDGVGNIVGIPVVGTVEGRGVGARLGSSVVGAAVGSLVGVDVGSGVAGERVGNLVGTAVGAIVGSAVGGQASQRPGQCRGTPPTSQLSICGAVQNPGSRTPLQLVVASMDGDTVGLTTGAFVSVHALQWIGQANSAWGSISHHLLSSTQQNS